MYSSVAAYTSHRGLRLLRPAARLPRAAEIADRALRLRIYLAWFLLFIDVVPFYKGTWNGLPLIVPIPSIIGKLITQGSLPLALLLVLSVNRRRLFRPNVFLTLLTLLVIAAVISGV